MCLERNFLLVISLRYVVYNRILLLPPPNLLEINFIELDSILQPYQLSKYQNKSCHQHGASITQYDKISTLIFCFQDKVLRIFTQDKHFNMSTVINMCPLYNSGIPTLIITYI